MKILDKYAFYYIFCNGGQLQMYSLEFYETSNGKSPATDFIRTMSSKAKAKFLQIAIS